MITLTQDSVRTISEAPCAASVASTTSIPILAPFKAWAFITSHSTYMLQLRKLLHNLVLVLWLKDKPKHLCREKMQVHEQKTLLLTNLGKAAQLLSLWLSSREVDADGYMSDPIPSLRRVYLAIAWSTIRKPIQYKIKAKNRSKLSYQKKKKKK